MPLTNYPNGVSSFGMPVMGVGEETMTTGNVFFVDSGAAAAADGNAMTDPAQPGATIDAAIARCTANNGDIIFVMPGHAETVAATDIALDVAGVWVRGIGWGADRPTITYSATGSTIAMSAASTRISNLRLAPGIANVVAAVTVSASDCIVEICETLTAAVFEFTSLIHVQADANRVIIRNNVLRNLFTAASGTSGILLDGCDELQITGNLITGFFAEHVIDNTTGSLDQTLNALIADNYLQQVGSGTDLVVEMDTDATGLLVKNMMSGTQALDGNLTGGNMRAVRNFCTDADDARAVGIPVTSAA